MFTGIIETLGRVVDRRDEKGNVHFDISAPFLAELKIDQSISHNGACLTVVALHENFYTVTAIHETLQKTNLASLKKNDPVNLERSLKIGDRLDGHLVQGHVDTTAVCADVRGENGSHVFHFTYDRNSGITVEKGSVCVNGVSLTVVNSLPGEFSVAIIPFTFSHTTFQFLKKGDHVNIEFDIVGKYIAAMMQGK